MKKKRTVQLSETVYGRVQGVEGRMIHGVVLLNSKSANGRYYPPATMERARDLFDDRRAYIDHPPDDKNEEPRSVRDLIGKFSNIGIEQVGAGQSRLTADLRVFAGQDGDRVIEIAKNDPDAIGFSINGRGDVTEDDEGKQTVEAIHRIRSVDLVTEPAATRTLFEGKQDTEDDTEGKEEMELKEELAEAKRRTEQLEREKDELAEAVSKAEEEKTKLEEKVAEAEREDKIAEAIKKAELTDEQVSETFLAALRRAPDDGAVVALIEDRKNALGIEDPESKEKDPLSERKKKDAPKVDDLAEIMRG